MDYVGLYKQKTSWTSESAGTSEWCRAEKDGKQYFVKKFLSPVYPSKDLGLPEKKYRARVEKFHKAEKARQAMYKALRESNTSGTLVIPEEVINYRFHLCTVAPFITSNVKPDRVCVLSEWQRIVLMRTLTLALMNVHQAGVVHCDLKPDNVLICQNADSGNCALKLIDFDSSFMESDPPEDVTGDPAFFAPEAYALASAPDNRLSRCTDVFSLGIIFHYFWTGKLPGKDAAKTLGQCVLEDKTPVLDAAVPGPLGDLIIQTMVKEPEKRIGTEEIYRRLGELLNAFPVNIINLQEKTEKKAELPPAGRKTPAGVLMVPVICSDTYGKNIESYGIDVPFGTSKAVYARRISGYHLASGETVETVCVDSKGYTEDSPVCFIYQKDEPKKTHGFRKFLVTVIILFLLYCVVMYLLGEMNINGGNYSQGIRYKEMIPFYYELRRIVNHLF